MDDFWNDLSSGDADADKSCPQCGARNPHLVDRCSSCSSPFPRPSLEAEGEIHDWKERQAKLADNALGAPPRAVPLLLIIAAFGPIISSLFLSAMLVMHRVGAQLPIAELRLALWGLLGLGFLVFVLRGLKRTALLRSGVAAAGEFLEQRSTWLSYDNTSMTNSRGWDLVRVSYSGPSYKTRVRVWCPTGRHAIHTIRGMSYDGGFFLFDPQKPSRMMPVHALGIPLRPASDGNWMVWPHGKKVLSIKLLVGAVVLGLTIVLVL